MYKKEIIVALLVIMLSTPILGTNDKTDSFSEGNAGMPISNMTKFDIVCVRNDIEKIFSVIVSSDIDPYSKEFEFRSACELFANDEVAWEAGSREESEDKRNLPILF